MTVSIVVPVYNAEETIAQCIDSLLQQDFNEDDFEIIVVNNASTDNTLGLLEQFINRGVVTLVSETEILNAYGARNKGVRAAKGDIIALIDGDCIAASDWLLKLLQNSSDASIGVFIGDILPYEPKNVLERYYNEQRMSLRTNQNSFPGMRAGNCAFRREVFNELKGFRTNVNSGGDSEFLYRVLTQTPYSFDLRIDSIVYHKNVSTLGKIFRRHLRFGTNLPTLQGHPYLGGSYISWANLIKGLIVHLFAFAYRLMLYPKVRVTGSYRGRAIEDMELYLMEPIIRLTQFAGNILGRLLQLRSFR